MAQQIFFNLAVKNLDASVKFFTKLGYTFNPNFTDESGTCMIVSETIFVMLLTEEKFKSLSPKPLCDATKSNEVLICLSCESAESLHKMVEGAVEAGGKVHEEVEDHGFMIQHGFEDLDGHMWGLVYIVPNALPKSEGQA